MQRNAGKLLNFHLLELSGFSGLKELVLKAYSWLSRIPVDTMSIYREFLTCEMDETLLGTSRRRHVVENVCQSIKIPYAILVNMIQAPQPRSEVKVEVKTCEVTGEKKEAINLLTLP